MGRRLDEVENGGQDVLHRRQRADGCRGGPIIEHEGHRGRHDGGGIGCVITGRCTLCQPAAGDMRRQQAAQLGEVGDGRRRRAPPRRRATAAFENEASRMTLSPACQQPPGP